jgi:hypothetical protein
MREVVVGPDLPLPAICFVTRGVKPRSWLRGFYNTCGKVGL